MNWHIHPALLINAVVALWFLYRATLHGIAFILNWINGQTDAPVKLLHHLIPAVVLAGLSVAAFRMMGNPVMEKAAVVLAWSPLLLVFVYFC